MGANIGTSITGWILCLSYIKGSGGIASILSTATISAVVAVIGIILTAIDMERFKVFSMICYLAMGWCVVVTWKPMTQAIGLGGTVFLVLGGVAYTIGAMLYVIGKKKNKRYVHSIFHLFVVLGSLLHFFCVLFYVM